MKRAIVFSHFNLQGTTDDYVFYWLAELKKVASFICFVSNSPLTELAKKRVLEFADVIFIRENKGYDFAAWSYTLKKVTWEKISSFDSLTLINDTCFGPLFNLSHFYTKMELNSNFDFWGNTNHPFKKNITIRGGVTYDAPEHLQSYFMVFNKNILQSDVFQSFFNLVDPNKSIKDVIIEYEDGLTGILQNKGFRYCSYIDAVKLGFKSDIKENYRLLLKKKSPFLKKKTFEVHKRKHLEIAKLINKKTNYPIEYILRYLSVDDLSNLPQNKISFKEKILRKINDIKTKYYVRK